MAVGGRWSSWATLGLVVAISACASEDLPTTTTPADVTAGPVMSASPAALPSGVQFLPPLGPTPPQTLGPLEATALPYLAVEICPATASRCTGAALKRYRPGPDGLKLATTNLGDVFQVAWKVTGDQFKLGQTYRIRILASGQDLGGTDVTPVGGTAPLAPGQIRQKSTVTIRFHLAAGTGQPLNPAGGTISLAQGQVQLTFPTGALTGPTFISATPAGNLLPVGGPAVVPGTVWEFGPTGTQFPRPVTMTIAYDPAQLPAGTVESELRVHKLVNGQYIQQNAGLVDLVNHTVSAQVTSFSTYVLVTRLFPGSQGDVTGPLVQVVDIFDPVTNLPTSALTLDVSGADVNVRVRFAATDDIVGVQSLALSFGNGVRPRRGCVASTLLSGSDTNGTWECTIPWYQFTAPDFYGARVTAVDQLGNQTIYASQTDPRFQCAPPGPPLCLAINPVTVVSSPADLTAPSVVSVEVSADVQPRVWGPTISVDLSSAPSQLVFGVRSTDDLSGLLGPGQNVGVQLRLASPSGTIQTIRCTLTQGSSTDGLFECPVGLPRGAATGTWTISGATTVDRVGNVRGYFPATPFPFGGPLCDAGNCIVPSTVQVTGAGDGAPPTLQSLDLSSDTTTTDVTVTANLTDALSGAVSAFAQFEGPSRVQTLGCNLSNTAGTPQNGTWACSVTFSPFAARGSWFLQGVTVRDAVGNVRSYFRQAGSSDTLCYFDATSQTICTNFGSLEVVVQ